MYKNFFILIFRFFLPLDTHKYMGLIQGQLPYYAYGSNLVSRIDFNKTLDFDGHFNRVVNGVLGYIG